MGLGNFVSLRFQWAFLAPFTQFDNEFFSFEVFFFHLLEVIAGFIDNRVHIELSCEILPVAISSVDGSLKGKLSFITPDISMNWYHSKIYDKRENFI